MEGKVALISGVGSQYALPVATPTASSTCGRQLVAIDYSEEALKANPIPPRAILPSGSAGGGLSQQLLTSVEHCLANPMIEGVSSLNPATGLAVNLRTWRLEQ